MSLTAVRSRLSARTLVGSLVQQFQAGILPLEPTNDAATELEQNWEHWLRTLFGRAFSDRSGDPVGFAQYHCEFWEWLWGIQPETRPRPFVAIWPRGVGKSTAAEIATIALGARSRRRYVLYVCETQDQADDHVQNIAALLESAAMAAYYPDVAERAVGKYGHAKGWRRNRLRTRSGFTVDALGLDSAARGAKLDEQRPNLLILDDLDNEQDSDATVAKKVTTLTTGLLPAGTDSLAVLAVQNLVHPRSIFASLASTDPEARATWLNDRIVSGPYPALAGFAYEQRAGRFVITAGEPTWAGLDRERCQKLIDTEGITSFKQERQHDVTDPPGGMFNHLEYRHCAPDEVPDLVQVGVWVDPAVTESDQSDSHGLIVDGIAEDRTIYRLFAWEERATPQVAIRKALLKAHEYRAQVLGIETNQGGQTWDSVVELEYLKLKEEGLLPDDWSLPEIASRKADTVTGSKAHRASQMLEAYERATIVHVLGTHQVMERALNRFPKKKPFDLVDAAFWSWDWLTGGEVYFA